MVDVLTLRYIRASSVQGYRLGEEQNEFCGKCVEIWTAWRKEKKATSTCHVCSNFWTEDTLSYALPVTSIVTGQASIACRECYNMIRNMTRNRDMIRNNQHKETA